MPCRLHAETRRFAQCVHGLRVNAHRGEITRQRSAQRMAARLRQREQQRPHRRLDIIEVRRNRSAKRQRPGLVDQRAIDLGQPLERRAVLDQHAHAHQRPRRDDLRRRHRKAERARAGDDQHRDRDQHALVPARARDHPAGKSEQRQRMDRGGIEPRRAVGDADIARLALRRLAHQPRDVGDRSVGARGGDLHPHRRIKIERPRMDPVIDTNALRHAFTGEQRQVDLARARGDDAVGGEPLARRDEHHHVGLKCICLDPAARAAILDDHRARAHVAQQRGHTAARAVAHHAVEPAPAQEEEDQHYDAVEIGVRPARRGLVQTKRRGDEHPDRNRHVHIGLTVAQRPPRRTEEGPPRISNRRQGDQRRQPVKQVARRSGGARPDRHREQHDVHHRKARDAHRQQQLAACRRLGFGSFIGIADRMRLKPQQREGADQIGGFGVGRARQMHPLFGEIDPRRGDSVIADQPLLEFGDAARAAHGGNCKIALDKQGGCGAAHLRSIR